MVKQIFAVITFLLLSFSSHAEDKAIIVFDASGSMWAQMDGKTKIEIAKKTLNDLVSNWDESKQLGLLAYGHRKKGDCKDIETLVPVGKINKARMISKVNKINPKGKTPISASIRMAADELKFTEDNATVILISDGKETCNADPCGTAAELEKLGVNFTAHVIGFGVDKQTSEQLKCIADNTGGKYFPANNAEQLNDALKKVVEQPKVITIRAINEQKGNILHKMVDWKLINQETEEVISLNGTGAAVYLNLEDDKAKDTQAKYKKISTGKWLISGTSGNYSGESSAEITGDEDQLIKVNMNKQLPKVTITALDEATIGTALDLSWEAPKDLNGLINLQIKDEKANFNSRPYTYTKNKKEAVIRLPSLAGDYVLRYYDVHDDRTVLAEKPITLKPAEIVINAPDEAGIGTEIDLSWVAPKTSQALINLQLADEKPNFNTRPYLYTKGKKEATMRLPSNEGDYVLRWYNQSDQKPITEHPLKLIKEEIIITAPDEAGTGTEIDISWTAPKTSEALINLQLADEKPNYNTRPYLYTKRKKEATMRLPSTEGEYVLRWYNQSDQNVMVERPIKLVKAEIIITAPDEAGTGTEIDISWTAPKTSEALINLQLTDEKPNYNTRPYLYTKGKKEATMRLPSNEGDYVLRWYNQSDQKVVAERVIKLVKEEITITAPDEVGAGSEIDISWLAPKTAEALIGLQLADEKPNYNSRPYLYTKGKKEATMRMPSTEGNYVLRYFNQSDQKVIAEHPIKLIAENITINAPAEATAGTEIELSWDAPKGLKAFINLHPADEKPNYNARPYVYTTKKQSAYLRMPSTAGDYILRWFNQGDKSVVAERPITLRAAEIAITAPDEGIAGTEIEISWTAPKGLDSFINIQLADEKANYNAKPYTYTKKKSSGYFRLPSTAGDYKLRWYNRGHKKVITERAIKLVVPDIVITAPEEAIAGSEIEISWQAPKSLDSFINIQKAGEKPSYNAKTYVSTKKKTSAYLKIPEETGDFVLRWYNRNDRKMINEKKIKIISGE